LAMSWFEGHSSFVQVGTFWKKKKVRRRSTVRTFPGGFFFFLGSFYDAIRYGYGMMPLTPQKAKKERKKKTACRRATSSLGVFFFLPRQNSHSGPNCGIRYAQCCITRWPKPLNPPSADAIANDPHPNPSMGPPEVRLPGFDLHVKKKLYRRYGRGPVVWTGWGTKL
jgi:hypothetical protein